MISLSKFVFTHRQSTKTEGDQYEKSTRRISTWIRRLVGHGRDVRCAGYIYFQNYASGVEGFNAPVTFGSSGQAVNGGTITVAGYGVGSEFTADLLYSLNGFSLYIADTSQFRYKHRRFRWVPGSIRLLGSTVDGPLTSPPSGILRKLPGYFIGDAVQIPGYTSGPVTFIVEAYNGSSYAASVGPGFGEGNQLHLKYQACHRNSAARFYDHYATIRILFDSRANHGGFGWFGFGGAHVVPPQAGVNSESGSRFVGRARRSARAVVIQPQPACKGFPPWRRRNLSVGRVTPCAPPSSNHNRRARDCPPYLLIPKRLHEWLQLLQIGFEIFLIIPPAADRAFIHRLGHVGVSGCAHHFLPGMCVKLQYLRVP